MFLISYKYLRKFPKKVRYGFNANGFLRIIFKVPTHFTGRNMRYRVMSYHEISVKYHKPDMAMIAHIKNHTHISIRYVYDFLLIKPLFFKEIS